MHYGDNWISEDSAGQAGRRNGFDIDDWNDVGRAGLISERISVQEVFAIFFAFEFTAPVILPNRYGHRINFITVYQITHNYFGFFGVFAGDDQFTMSEHVYKNLIFHDTFP